MKEGAKKQRRSGRKKTLLFFLAGLMMLSLTALMIDYNISKESADLIYSDITKIPTRKAALVLGTAKHTQGRENAFYNLRLDAAEALFKAGKVKALLISGDNSKKDYDEPSAMRDDLVTRGIPAEFITLDFAGFRTLDSVVRAKEVFDVDDYIVISQRFHCERALYISNTYQHKAIACVAQDVTGVHGIKIRLREVLARCKAFLDVNILNTAPKFLGKKETVRYKE